MRKVGLAGTIVLSLVFGLTLACTLTAKKTTWHCQPVPAGFQEKDLWGTWQARYYIGHVTDTLILLPDHTYQQIYEDDEMDYYYTSPWNAWYLEPRASGGFYLHLAEMHYCLGTMDECQREGGGGDNWWFHEDCEGRFVRLSNEVILTVAGARQGLKIPGAKFLPKGLLLGQLRDAADTYREWFVLLKPYHWAR
jgi:hypothetical protein